MADTDTATSFITPPSRNELRSKIFSNKPIAKEVISFFGVDIELRQPTLGDIIEAQSNPDRQSGVIDVLVRYAYAPGSEEHVFEAADADVLKSMPFGQDFVRVSQALERLTSVDFLNKKEPPKE